MTIRDTLPPTIRTERLTLRAPVMTDLTAIVALLGNWNVVQNTAAIPYPYGEEDGRHFLAMLDDPAQPRNYAIADAGDQLMGIIGLKCAPDQLPEIGYWLGEPYWGHGYVSEAALALVKAVDATQKVAELRGRALDRNLASIRIMEKCGFVPFDRTTSAVERHLGEPVTILSRKTP